MSIDDGLELRPASPEELEDAVRHFATSERLHDQGFNMFVGKKVGQHANYYWLPVEARSSSNQYVLDFGKFLDYLGAHITSMKVIGRDESRLRRKTLMQRTKLTNRMLGAVAQTNQLLAEILEMHISGKIDSKGEVLGYSNSGIRKDVEYMRGVASKLAATLSDNELFRLRIGVLVEYYEKWIQPKYGEFFMRGS